MGIALPVCVLCKALLQAVQVVQRLAPGPARSRCRAVPPPSFAPNPHRRRCRAALCSGATHCFSALCGRDRRCSRVPSPPHSEQASKRMRVEALRWGCSVNELAVRARGAARWEAGRCVPKSAGRLTPRDCRWACTPVRNSLVCMLAPSLCATYLPGDGPMPKLQPLPCLRFPLARLCSLLAAARLHCSPLDGFCRTPRRTSSFLGQHVWVWSRDGLRSGPQPLAGCVVRREGPCSRRRPNCGACLGRGPQCGVAGGARLSYGWG